MIQMMQSAYSMTWPSLVRDKVDFFNHVNFVIHWFHFAVILATKESERSARVRNLCETFLKMWRNTKVDQAKLVPKVILSSLRRT